MTSLRDAASPEDLYEMNAVGEAIGTVYVAAYEAAQHPRNPILQIRLHRTVALAQVRGADTDTLTETIRLARKEATT